jgi:hypothetical protein
MKFKIIPVALALSLLGIVGGVWVTHSNSAGTDVAPMQGNMTIDQAKGFSGFALYDAGDSVAGFQLNAVEKTVDAEHGTTNITFLYGDCIPPQDASGRYEGGCPPPVQVQVWNGCVRNPTVYGGVGAPQGDHLIIRGVPALSFDNGSRVEMYTGRSTVVIFADPKFVPEVAAAIRGVTNSVPAELDLPAPAADVMNGTAKCV